MFETNSNGFSGWKAEGPDRPASSVHQRPKVNQWVCLVLLPNPTIWTRAGLDTRGEKLNKIRKIRGEKTSNEFGGKRALGERPEKDGGTVSFRRSETHIPFLL